MRFFVFSLMLAAAAHAITCTEGLLMYYKELYGLYLGETNVIYDSSYVYYTNQENFESTKLIRNSNRIMEINESFVNGKFNSNTSVFFYLTNDISNPSNSSIVFQKNFLGDTLFIEAIVDEPDDEENPRISQQTIKIFKDGITNIVAKSDINENIHERYTEIFQKNDTLYVISRSTSNGVPMGFKETHFILNEEEDPQTCHEYYEAFGCAINKCTDVNGNQIKDGDIMVSYDYSIKENDSGYMIEHTRYNKIFRWFMVYQDKSPTSFARRVIHTKSTLRNYYFDTKGRKLFKASPYRVQF